MFEIWLNEEQYEYDIRGLVMAFYPGIEISCKMPEAQDSAVYEPPAERRAIEKENHAEKESDADNAEEVSLRLTVRYEQTPERIELLLTAQQESEQTFCRTAAADIAGMNRTEVKTALKCALYELLSEQTGRTLVWGTLTGIRPTKIAMALLEEGKTKEETAKMMRDTYLVSEGKAALSADIAIREKELLDKLDYEKGYSLYIGIPFCPTTCLYCSFTSYPIFSWAKKVDAYLDALIVEMKAMAKHFKNRHLNTIYIGGGTPTTLTAEQLDRLLSAVTEYFDLSHMLEFTVEAGRPDSITVDKLLVLRKYPVDRISINPQTMNDETLRLIGRRHNVEQVREAFYMAREAGFVNINMDLILGLPEETCHHVRYTMEELARLNPDNITVHSLALKRASRLNTDAAYEHYRYNSRDSESMMDIAMAYTKQLGMEPYYLYRQKNMTGNLENIGYAREGKAGIYNILIMEEKQTILALGAGATTKAVYGDGRIERAENVKDVQNYLDRVDEMIQRKMKLFEGS